MDLDARLARGPLRARSLWSAGPSAAATVVIERRVLARKRLSLALDAVALCACLVLAIALGGRFHPVTAFADGSTAEASSRDTELHVEEDSATRVVTRLSGGARFAVVPNHARSFEVRAGDVRVRVLGTLFSVQQLPSGQTQVLVERGRVEVAWLGGATVLEGGQGGAFPPATSPEPEPEAAIIAPHQSEPTPAQSATPPPAPRAARPPSSLDAPDEVGELMNAADVARLGAHPAEAVPLLRQVYEGHARDRRAPVAAFTLGRVLFDDLGRPADAAVAFRKAHTLWESGPLAEDALAREADAWDRAGRAENARSAAGDYLGRYPAGRHAAAMRSIGPR